MNLMVILSALVFAACPTSDGGGDDFVELYAVAYDRNDATTGTVPYDANEYEEGWTVTVQGNTGGLDRDGYVYSGWNTRADGSGTTRTQGETFLMGNSTVRLYAKWTANSVATYRVTYDVNGATGGTPPADSTNYEVSQTVTVQGNTGSLVRTGYTFAGWNTAADGSGTGYAAGAAFAMGTTAVRLYAKWTTNPTYTVTYNANGATGGTPPTDSTNYEEGQPMTVQGNTGNLSWSDNRFTGWNTASDGSGTSYAAGASFAMPAANVTLYARWTPFAFAAAAAAEANGWRSVTYGNGLFVAVADNGTNQVMTSPDGITWTARVAAEANTWFAVTYGNGLFVAVASGSDGVMTSPDGITWTAHTAAYSAWWMSVTYGNGLFVAVADGSNGVMTSPDGVTWTARVVPEANGWRSVTYGNGLFVALAYNGTNQVMTSPDGINWTARFAAEALTWVSVIYANGLFVAVALDGTSQVMTSPDGIDWTSRTTIAESNNWNSVAYGNGLFVAVAASGTNRVMTSPDGITWTARAAAEASGWYSVTYSNNRFIAVASTGTNRVMYADW
jgi:uncharacterized repeat protein (TIGR02543 family)